ncbi:MAG: hypothetical protein JSW67_13340 [Candidatus Latescibacterota bacterium]|nr:MAG: hypothetical protein JSW67_13340 [Candidatus Latescibacterota bacterium]
MLLSASAPRLLLAAGLLASVPREAATEALPTGQFVEGITCRSDTTQTYTLYLPSSYQPEREWPALLVFDPRGRSLRAATLFRDAAESYGWIVVSSNDTRSDGPCEPNARALRALWPEVHERYAVDAERIYAAGFSGGVLVAWDLAQFAKPPSLAGIIGAGGRPAPEIPVETIAFAHFGTAGHLDFNDAAMKELDAIVEKRAAPRARREAPRGVLPQQPQADRCPGGGGREARCAALLRDDRAGLGRPHGDRSRAGETLRAA